MSDKLVLQGVFAYGYGIVPMMVIADRRLSSSAVRLYGALMNYSRGKNCAYPKRETLSDVLGCTLKTVTELTAELESCGYVTKLREGKHGGLTYTMNLTLQGELFSEPQICETVKSNMKTKQKTEKKSETGTEEINSILDVYVNKFKEISGHEPEIVHARDRAIIVRYIKKYGTEKLKEIIELYFKNSWGKKCGYTITSLQTVFNQLLMESNKKKKGFGFEKV